MGQNKTEFSKNLSSYVTFSQNETNFTLQNKTLNELQNGTHSFNYTIKSFEENQPTPQKTVNIFPTFLIIFSVLLVLIFILLYTSKVISADSIANLKNRIFSSLDIKKKSEEPVERIFPEDFLDELHNRLKERKFVFKNDIFEGKDKIAIEYGKELLEVINNSELSVVEKKKKILQLYENPLSGKLSAKKNEFSSIVLEVVGKYKDLISFNQLPPLFRTILKNYNIKRTDNLELLFEELVDRLTEKGIDEIKDAITFTIIDLKNTENIRELEKIIEEIKEKIERRISRIKELL